MTQDVETLDQPGVRMRTEVKASAPAVSGGQRAIELGHVNVSYGENHVIHDVSMDIDARMVTAFIGPSGCGKSTLLRCLNRMNDLVEGAQIGGKIRVLNQDI